MQAIRHPGTVRALPQPGVRPATSESVVLRRIDCLLELGAQLAQLPESLADDESRPGRLPGAFYLTRLPVLLKQMELLLSAIRALGGRTPQIVEQLVADPDRFRNEGTKLILEALAEIDLVLADESLVPRPAARLQSAD
jgi:hypothetical protein